MLSTRLSCAKTSPPLMRQSGDRWHASAPLSESAGRHDGLAFLSCILTKCAAAAQQQRRRPAKAGSSNSSRRILGSDHSRVAY